MLLRLLLLFTLVPLVELALLIQVGERVGLPATIALVFLTGILGAFLARAQGLATLARLRAEMAAGRMPTDALLDGLLILIAAAVLVTPGLLTDVFGFALLVPAGRRAVGRLVRGRLGGLLRRPGDPRSPAPRVIVIEPEDDR